MQKVSDQKIIETYLKTRNLWKCAELLGICGQSVHERLVKLKIKLNYPRFSEEEKLILQTEYSFFRDSGNLKELANKLNRTVPFICRKAKELGLTDIKHKKSSNQIALSSERLTQLLKNKHPKGMLGKTHSEKTLQILRYKSKEYQNNMSTDTRDEIIMKMLKTKEKNGTLYQERPKTSWKSGWREIGGINKYYRSRWEANYARYLQFLKEHKEIKNWEHEAETFWFTNIKRGCRSYLPDFRVTLNNEEKEYHEVKGWMDDKSKTKLKRMAKYYPEIKIVLIEREWFKYNTPKLKGFIKDWEK